ncbi:MAG: ribbon-helix-helix protein, CopG family [Crenarchaeota archaeon]|nr:ribbon-helix-helix protein, CopG family [Thermoproteota archaeon]
MTNTKQRDDNKGFRLPESIAQEMDKLIGTHGFTSRAEIAKQAIREYLEKIRSEENLHMVNHGDNGVKVRDTKLGRVADIQITPNGIYCPVCDASNCEHIRFALMQPDIQKIVTKKRKEGWKLPDV